MVDSLAAARHVGAARMRELIDSGIIVPYMSSEVTSISRDHVALKTKGGELQIANDHVIVQIGGTAPSDLLKTIGIELVEKRGTA